MWIQCSFGRNTTEGDKSKLGWLYLRILQVNAHHCYLSFIQYNKCRHRHFYLKWIYAILCFLKDNHQHKIFKQLSFIINAKGLFEKTMYSRKKKCGDWGRGNHSPSELG